MKKQNLSRSLIASILSLVMCVSMFIGVTFAWFTDEVVSAGNIIQAGNLSIDFEVLNVDSNGTRTWSSLKESKAPVFNYMKWEPGYTEFKIFKVENEGSLDFKWKALIYASESFGALAEVIDVYVISSTTELDYPADRNLTGYTKVGTLKDFAYTADQRINGTLLHGESSYFGIALKMRTEAGNDYQGLSLPKFDIRIVAGQLSSESDSFDDQYDADATFPELPNYALISAPVGSVDTNNNLNDAVAIGDSNGQFNASVPAGVKVESGATNLTLNVKPTEADTANITLTDGQISRTLDVCINGVDKNNTTPMVVNLGKVLPAGLKPTSIQLYHIEGDTPVLMTCVDSFTAHNQFIYDSATGSVSINIATFSNFVLIAEPSDPWDGTEDAEWMADVKANYDTTSEFSISSPEQLAALGTLVAEGYDFAGKTVKITKSLDLGGHAAEPKTFYPIGYRYSETNTNDNVGTFRGTLDGELSEMKPDGKTHQRARIFHLSQSTWAIKGHYGNGYYNRSLGLFAHLEDATIKNLVIEHFEIEGEFADTGCIAGGASGATFDNISFYRNDIATYNTGVGALVGWDWGDNEDFYFSNIHIDDTNYIRALWGSWDVACGGLMGFLESTSRANISDCIIAPKLDVFNDVCANYQYYQYRYSGMLIGTVGRDSVPKSENITCSNVKVYLGDWTDYYYCEFEKNTGASYTEDFQFSRVEERDIVFDLFGNPINCTHEHTVNEDRFAYHLPFSQLYTGYSWGAQAVYAHPGVEVLRYDYTITYFDGTHVVGAEYVLDNSADYTLHIYPVEGNVWVDVYGKQITSIPAGTESNVMLYLNTLKQNMIRFVDQDGFVISEQDFDLGKDAAYYKANVIEPAVPQIPGYVGIWPDYITMLVKATGDVVVHPVYSTDDEFEEEDILDTNFDLNTLFRLISEGEALTMYQDLTGNFTSANTKIFSEVVKNPTIAGDKDARLDLDSFKLELDCSAKGNQDWVMFKVLSGSTLTIGAGRSGSGTLTFDFQNLHQSSHPSIFNLENGGTLVIERGVTIEVHFPVGDKNHDATNYVGAIVTGFSYTTIDRPDLAKELGVTAVKQMEGNAYKGVYIVTDADTNTVKLVVTGDTVFVGN